MFINADFSQVAVITPEDYHWVSSPRGEVQRVMLDRIGAEHARATSLVRYAPHSLFPAHQHPYGEEILVLSGTFSENGDQHYPTGWYLRNPHNSAHVPSSEDGALIFVKLMQMAAHDNAKVRINTHDANNWHALGQRQICPLHQFEQEQTYLEKLEPYQYFSERSLNGIELLILQGELITDGKVYPTGTWLRLPIQYEHDFSAGTLGATLYIKTEHLRSAQEFLKGYLLEQQKDIAADSHRTET